MWRGTGRSRGKGNYNHDIMYKTKKLFLMKGKRKVKKSNFDKTHSASALDAYGSIEMLMCLSISVF